MSPTDSKESLIPSSPQKSSDMASMKSKVPQKPTRHGHPASGWKPHPIFRFIQNHQIDIPLLLILVAILPRHLPHLFPSFVSQFCASLYTLSYPTDTPIPNDEFASYLENKQLYTNGPLDVNFTLFYVLVVLLIRELSMRYIFRPLATFHNIRSSAMITRFQEQAWLAVYYTTFFSLGFYLAYNSPYFTNFTLFWVNYPHKTYSGLFKSYYLLQLSFSIAQLVVLHIEKPRKDYVQYLVHHIVTICLVAGSYAMNYTRIGNMIFIVMDVADIFLSSAKCLKYLGYTNACDVQFGLFVLVWFLSRHIAYPLVVSSIPFDLYGWSLPWEAQSKQPIKMNYDPSNGAYLSDNVISGFVVLFAGLKVLILYWGYLIARIVVKVVKGKGGAEDTRSDDESDCEEEEIKDAVDAAAKSKLIGEQSKTKISVVKSGKIGKEKN